MINNSVGKIKRMNVASCGLGTNSIAGIIHAINNGYVFDEILFANTGRGKKFGEQKRSGNAKSNY